MNPKKIRITTMRTAKIFPIKLLIPLYLLLTVLAFFPPTASGKTDNTKKIIGTHYTGDTWAPSAWSNMNINRVSEDLAKIKTNGFNTVILTVPWVGFQTSVDPIHYSDEYFQLLEEVFAIAQKLDLKIIIRIGYSHEIGLSSTPDHYTRFINMFSNKKVLTAWQDYLARLNATASKFDNFQFGFISWEDFFLVGFTHASENERLQLATLLGFTEYIKKYPLGELSAMYQGDFQQYAQVPLPSNDSPAVPLLHEFWDFFLLKLQRESKRFFPKLSLEVRVDCDPSPVGSGYVCHENTFDVGNESDTTLIYFSPAWGADNQGKADSAEQVLQRLDYLLDKIRRSTDNSIFIDQFNFIDNTPGFDRNTKIKPEELPKFIEKSFGIIDRKTIGYALWTLQDLVGNCIANGSFERGETGWKINDGKIYFDQVHKENRLILNDGGIVEQEMHLGTFVNPDVVKSGATFTLNFNAASQNGTPVDLMVQVLDPQGIPIFHSAMTVSGSEFMPIHLSGLPLIGNGSLQMSSRNGSIQLDNVELYFMTQENGIYDVQGQPRAFRDATLAFNQALAASASHYLEYYKGADLHSEDLKGIFADDWVGQEFSGTIKVPKGPKGKKFIIEATVPNWDGYKNVIDLYLANNKMGSCSLSPGHTKCTFKSKLSKSSEESVSFRVVASHVVLPEKYEANSRDVRKLAFVLSGIGFK
jgi:hypothetical protein